MQGSIASGRRHRPLPRTPTSDVRAIKVGLIGLDCWTLREELCRGFVTAVCIVTSVLVTLATGAVAQKVPPEIPLAIICWNEQTKSWRVGNLSTIKEDGTATYVTPSGQLSSTLNAKGVAVPPSNRPANPTASARP
jgi:hypothetical protein